MSIMFSPPEHIVEALVAISTDTRPRSIDKVGRSPPIRLLTSSFCVSESFRSLSVYKVADILVFRSGAMAVSRLSALTWSARLEVLITLNRLGEDPPEEYPSPSERGRK